MGKPNGDFAHQRELMVERHIAGRGIRDLRVLEAMRRVPRHLFVPDVVASKAYSPAALPIGNQQTISHPYIVARMLEILELGGQEQVLEIGTGSGYQTALLSHLSSRVFSIERIHDLAVRASDAIRRLDLHNVSIKVFDGTYGWSDQAPFDRIIVSASAPEIPEPLIQQLTRKGRMAIPIGAPGSQRLALVSRIGTSTQIEDMGPAEFVPLVGRFGWKNAKAER